MDETLDEPLPLPFLDDGLPVDQNKCRLFGPTALVVQALMGVFVILSLVLKRQREKPMRLWKIWCFDVSKQIAGQMFLHGLNVLISDLGAHRAAGNPCSVYILNILVDTTFGVGLIYFVHHLLTQFFSNTLQLKGFASGQYGDPPSFWFWLRQFAVYGISLTIMKLTVVSLFAIWPRMFRFGDWLLSWTKGRDYVQIIFVMGAIPIVMNVLQFWLIDSIVKASAYALAPESSPRQSADREPLFNDTGDDDDEEGVVHSQSRHDIENPAPSGSRSRSISSRKSSVDEQKTISSRTSTKSPEQQSDHDYPSHTSSASPSGSSIRSYSRRPSTNSPAPKRKRSPPPPLRLHDSPASVDASGVKVIAVAGTPLSGRTEARDTGNASSVVTEKLSSGTGQRD